MVDLGVLLGLAIGGLLVQACYGLPRFFKAKRARAPALATSGPKELGPYRNFLGGDVVYDLAQDLRRDKTIWTVLWEDVPHPWKSHVVAQIEFSAAPEALWLIEPHRLDRVTQQLRARRRDWYQPEGRQLGDGYHALFVMPAGVKAPDLGNVAARRPDVAPAGVHLGTNTSVVARLPPEPQKNPLAEPPKLRGVYADGVVPLRVSPLDPAIVKGIGYDPDNLSEVQVAFLETLRDFPKKLFTAEQQVELRRIEERLQAYVPYGDVDAYFRTTDAPPSSSRPVPIMRGKRGFYR